MRLEIVEDIAVGQHEGDYLGFFGAFSVEIDSERSSRFSHAGSHSHVDIRLPFGNSRHSGCAYVCQLRDVFK